MKKNKTKDQEQKPRLNLNRETIRFLDDPALFGVAGGELSVGTGGQTGTTGQGPTLSIGCG